MKTVKLENVKIWRHQKKANDIAITFNDQITSVNNIEGSDRYHKNLYKKLNKILLVHKVSKID